MNKFFYFILLGISLGILFFMFYFMKHDGKPIESEHITVMDPPFNSSIFGVGIVEAKGGNINIGSSINRIVEKIFVTVGSKIKKGDDLLKFENNDLRAEVMLQELDYQQAQANLKKIKALPRPEDLAAAEAALKIAELSTEQALSQYNVVKNLKDSKALSQEEINRRLFAWQSALAKQQQVQADFDKVKAGAWAPDVDIAQLKVLQAKSRVMQSKSNLQRTVIKSPINATILQIKIREGEVPSGSLTQQPLMIIGNTDELNLKVSINQFDVPRFQSNAKAIAFLQGDHRFEFPLEFIRIEPILVSKQNLTNDIAEKVDTDVLNIIYRIKTTDQPLYIGQQMDVYIESRLEKELPHNPHT